MLTLLIFSQGMVNAETEDLAGYYSNVNKLPPNATVEVSVHHEGDDLYIEWMIEPSTPYPHIMQDKSRITTIHSAGKGRISRTLEFDFDSDGWENKGHGSFCQTKEGYIFTVTATGASPSATNSVDDQFMRGEGLGVGGHRTYRLQRRSRKPIQIFPY